MGTQVLTKRHCLILNVVNFLQKELTSGNLNDEKKESVEVAIQCLETAYELDPEAKSDLEKFEVDLLPYMRLKEKIVVTEERAKEAEECKNKGNSHMKNGSYMEAFAEYSRAIEIDPYNAVYYCNRAAALSRLERNVEALKDCQDAITIDPNYAKAYSRQGIAFSNLRCYEDARDSCVLALKHDPGNTMYENNLKLAEEKLLQSMEESAAPPEHTPVDISQFINNPNLINMATQMLGDSNFRDLMSRFMSMSQSGDPNLEVLFQAGQTLASRMQSADPSFVDNSRRALDPENMDPEENNIYINNGFEDTSKKSE